MGRRGELVMPMMRCEKDGVQGWKWGENGTCYVGEDAKEKAEEQRRAIEASKHKDRKTKIKIKFK